MLWATLRDGASEVASKWCLEESCTHRSSAHRPAHVGQETISFGANWAVFSSTSAISGRFQAKVGRNGAEIGPRRHKFGRLGQISAGFGRIWSMSGQCWSKSGQSWSRYDHIRRKPAEVGQALVPLVPDLMMSCKTAPPTT